MRIAEGVEMMELEMQAFGQRSAIHPMLIWDEAGAVLIDVGMPNQLNDIREAMNRAGVSFEHLKAVIITHQDIDHFGSLPDLLENSDHSVEVYAHEVDKPYLEGIKHPIKMDLSLIGEGLKYLPETVREEVEHLCKNPPKARVDKALTDGQELPFCGGITVIHTPGHTPGHISLYLRVSRTLIAADALMFMNGKLQGPNPHNTPDMSAAIQSLERLMEFPFERIICYHGGLCEDNAKAQLKELIEQCSE